MRRLDRGTGPGEVDGDDEQDEVPDRGGDAGVVERFAGAEPVLVAGVERSSRPLLDLQIDGYVSEPGDH